MPKLVWDKIEDRVYESGLDQGVLYLPNGSAVAWSGLTSVVEHSSSEVTPVYFDGRKINDLVVPGDFSATMKAITYPDEFSEFEGIGELRNGVFVGDQKPKPFDLGYRTRVGNAAEGDSANFKLNLIYNVTAIPSDKSYATLGQDPSLVEFEWNLTAIPEEIPGFLPTAHLVFDSRELDPWLLEELEAMFYGTTAAIPSLLPMLDLVDYVSTWYRVKITDNGDGTWTATTQRDGFITILNAVEGTFKIEHVNAVYVDEDEFIISDTTDVAQVPQIRIIDNGDGSWIAETEHDNVIVMTGPDTFEIRNAEAVYLTPDEFLISDTID